MEVIKLSKENYLRFKSNIYNFTPIKISVYQLIKLNTKLHYLAFTMELYWL